MGKGLQIVLIGLTALRALAAEPPKKPTLIKEAGKPLQIIFEDGRIASYQIEENDPMMVVAPFSVSENTCTGAENIICGYQMPLVLARTALVWEAHPDKDRVGKPLHLKFGEFDFDALGFNILMYTDKLRGVKYAQKIPPDEMICKDYSWLPDGKGETPPEKLVVSRWDTEQMRLNPETGLMENRITGGALNVTWTKTDKNNLRLDRMDYLTGSNPSLVQGDILALIIRQSNNDLCQISLKPNSSKANDEVMKILFNKNYHFKSYVWGADEFSSRYYPTYFDQIINGIENGNPT